MNRNEQLLSEMKEIVGYDLYCEICDKLSGADIHIPALLRGFSSREERDRAIRLDYYNLVDIVDLQKKYKLSNSAIRKIIDRKP